MLKNEMPALCAVLMVFVLCCDPVDTEKGVEFKAQAVNLSSVQEDET